MITKKLLLIAISLIFAVSIEVKFYNGHTATIGLENSLIAENCFGI